MNRATTIRIGTSGWHYKHWVGKFYPLGLPAARMLPWYTSHFDTVEINNTFYRLPTEDSLVKWRQTVSTDFLFSVKASRFITHMKLLLDPSVSTEKFFSRVALLGSTLGPILFQLPPGFRLNLARLEQFIDALPANYMYVFEFRDSTWETAPVYNLLRRHNVALCIHDWRGLPSPRVITADFTYIRFHGPTGNYSGGYCPESLTNWADQVRQWQSLRNAFIYFNNDGGGHAITDAKNLRKLLQQRVLMGVRAA